MKLFKIYTADGRFLCVQGGDTEADAVRSAKHFHGRKRAAYGVEA